jgi:hypothetical protein
VVLYARAAALSGVTAASGVEADASAVELGGDADPDPIARPGGRPHAVTTG